MLTFNKQVAIVISRSVKVFLSRILPPPQLILIFDEVGYISDSVKTFSELRFALKMELAWGRNVSS